MFEPDLEKFKRKMDEGFDFQEVVHGLLKRPVESDGLDEDVRLRSREKTRRAQLLRRAQRGPKPRAERPRLGPRKEFYEKSRELKKLLGDV